MSPREIGASNADAAYVNSATFSNPMQHYQCFSSVARNCPQKSDSSIC